ncbi:hypothetical protein ASF08_11800 [Methylobacterium sp. Leaf85]|nr:hypothetical protein ASF08_11800 [Methylobacterium sp. Leaf85]
MLSAVAYLFKAVVTASEVLITRRAHQRTPTVVSMIFQALLCQPVFPRHRTINEALEERILLIALGIALP